MRRTLGIAFAALVAASLTGWQARGAQRSAPASQAQPQTQTQTKSQSAPSQGSSLAEAAKKARQNQKNPQSAPVVFTNDNMPRSSTISVVGNTNSSSATAGTRASTTAAKDDETTWRLKFINARAKLRQDQEKLVFLRNDLNSLGFVRYFSESDAVAKQKAVQGQENQITADQKAIEDLQDALRKAGGDPAWAQ